VDQFVGGLERKKTLSRIVTRSKSAGSINQYLPVATTKAGVKTKTTTNANDIEDDTTNADDNDDDSTNACADVGATTKTKPRRSRRLSKGSISTISTSPISTWSLRKAVEENQTSIIRKTPTLIWKEGAKPKLKSKRRTIGVVVIVVLEGKRVVGKKTLTAAYTRQTMTSGSLLKYAVPFSKSENLLQTQLNQSRLNVRSRQWLRQIRRRAFESKEWKKVHPQFPCALVFESAAGNYGIMDYIWCSESDSFEYTLKLAKSTTYQHVNEKDLNAMIDKGQLVPDSTQLKDRNLGVWSSKHLVE
jgi:hypothetical protein